MKTLVTLFLLLIALVFQTSAQLRFDPFVELKAQAEVNLRRFNRSNVSNFRFMLSFGNRIKLINFPRKEYDLEAKLDSGKYLSFVPVFSINMLLGKGLGASMFDTGLKPRFTLVSSYNILYEAGLNKYYHQIQSFSPLVSAPIISQKSTVFNISANTVNIFNFKRQFVGGVFVGYKRISGSYHNDGPPFNNLNLGDGFDRMFTGSGSLAFNTVSKNLLSERYSNSLLGPLTNFNFNQKILRLGYERYTGYEKDKYEIAGSLKLDAVEYNNFKTNGYNRGLLKVEYLTEKFSGGIQINDFDDLDIQNIIHIIRKEPLHRSINRSSLSFIGSYYNTEVSKDEINNITKVFKK